MASRLFQKLFQFGVGNLALITTIGAMDALTRVYPHLERCNELLRGSKTLEQKKMEGRPKAEGLKKARKKSC